MSSARIGVPPASVWQWSDAHWLTSLRSRGDHDNSTQPEPPPSALPMAMNSARHRSNEPKSRASASWRGCIRFALITETFEEMLMKDHRIHGDKFFALEAIHQKAGSVGIIEFGELLPNKVQPLHSAAIVVFVVADDQPLEHSFDSRRIASERLHVVRHQYLSSAAGRGVIVMLSNRVTLSELVQSAVRPGKER